MNFEPSLRARIQTEIIRQFDNLLYPSLDFLKSNFSNYYRVAFENIMAKVPPYQIDLDQCVKFLLSSKEDINNASFQFKAADGSRWWDNEIRLPFINKMPEITEWGTPQFWAYREWRNNMEYTCENEFWGIDKFYSSSHLPSTEIFDNKVLKMDELPKYQAWPKFLFLKENWFMYVRSLVEIAFPQFKYSEKFSTKKMPRFLLELKEGIWFGFEYEVTDMAYELKRNETPSLPMYFNLIIINEAFDKKMDVKHYYFGSCYTVVSLGILGNPFFYHPCYPLIGFCAVDIEQNNKNGNPYKSEVVKIEEGQYRVLHPPKFADSMKRHAYFYMNLLATTSKPYLEYLQGVLKAAI